VFCLPQFGKKSLGAGKGSFKLNRNAVMYDAKKFKASSTDIFHFLDDYPISRSTETANHAW
jgi:hypothetical protein